jgi:hypothetical protein
MISVHAPASHYRSPIVRFGMRLFCVVLVASAIGVGVSVVRSVIDARASVNWPTVTGAIVRSSVDESPDPTHKTYEANIEYSYVADGRGRTGRNVQFGALKYKKREDAERFASKYPLGSTVTVYYKPSDPDTALLQPGVRPAEYLMLLIPPVMLVIAVGLWKATKRPAPPADGSTATPAPA